MEHPPAETLARVPGVGDELVLRRVGADLEIVGNGTFLMDTRDGRSERLLVRAALDLLVGHRLHLLLGGLGVGFSLAEALASPDVARVVVVEREPAVLDWGRTHLAPFSGNGLDDPRVHAVQEDLVTWLAGGPPGERGFDALCLDVDNGPGWTVTEGNARLYGDAGLAAAARWLRPGGVLTVWSAHDSPSFADALRRHLVDVHTLAVPVPRGEPDVVYVARRRGGPGAPHRS
ncbi:MAG: spermidine synthase [Actinomycetes bacterium]